MLQAGSGGWEQGTEQAGVVCLVWGVQRAHRGTGIHPVPLLHCPSPAVGPRNGLSLHVRQDVAHGGHPDSVELQLQETSAPRKRS